MRKFTDIVATLVLVGVISLPINATPSPRTQRVTLYFVTDKIDWKTNKALPCTGELASLSVTVDVNTTPLEDTIRTLLDAKDEYYQDNEHGETELRNPLHVTDLKIIGVSLDGEGTVYVSLAGKSPFHGIFSADRYGCDLYYMSYQLKQTARQFSSNNNVIIYINGNAIEGSFKSKE